MGAMTESAPVPAALLLSAAEAALAAADAAPVADSSVTVDAAGVRARLSAAARPMLLLGDGAGWSDGACADIALFAGANALSAAAAAGGSDRLDNENPCYAGTLGPAADPRLTARLADADCLVAVGAVPAPWMDHPALCPLPGDAAAVAAALAAMEPVAEVPWTDWAIAARRDYLDWSAADPWPGPVDVGAILGWLRERLPTDAVVAADAGPLAGLAQRHLLFRRPGRLLGGPEGMAGFAAAAAVAARAARPRRMAVGFTDAAGLVAAAPLLERAAAERVPVLVIVVNEDAAVDGAAVARHLGVFAAAVTSSPDFIQAFWDGLWSRSAALIELRVEKGQTTTQTLWDAARAAAMTQAEG